MAVADPPTRDRMPGAYCGPRCPHCRAEPGPGCADTARATKRLRHAERAALRRHVVDILGTESRDPLLDPSDCIHGCSGGRYGCSDWCNFTCHERATMTDDRQLPQPADPDRACPHEDFTANVEVNRLTRSDDDPTVIGYDTSITVACANCGEPFRWIGVQAGLSPSRPMCSVNETELRAPIRPASADPDFGLGIPGFAVTWQPGGGDA